MLGDSNESCIYISGSGFVQFGSPADLNYCLWIHKEHTYSIKLDLASLQLLLQGQYVLTSVEIILIQDSNITVYMDVSDSTTTCEPFGHRGIQQSLNLLRTCFFILFPRPPALQVLDVSQLQHNRFKWLVIKLQQSLMTNRIENNV